MDEYQQISTAGTIFELINSRLSAPCLDQANELFLAELIKLEQEILAGFWNIKNEGFSIGVSNDPVLNLRVGNKITASNAILDWPVLKDTIIQRMKTAGLLTNLIAAVNSLSVEDRFEFDQSSWFKSSNPKITAGIVACGGDPIAILAFDSLA